MAHIDYACKNNMLTTYLGQMMDGQCDSITAFRLSGFWIQLKSNPSTDRDHNFESNIFDIKKPTTTKMKFAATVLAVLATPTVALNGEYLSSMGGGNAMKAPTFMPRGGYAVPQGGPASYLDQFAAPAPGGYDVLPADSPVFSFSEMDMSGVVAASSREYLTSLKVSATSGSGSGPTGFLDTLRVNAAESAATSLPGYLDTLRVHSSTVYGATGPRTYLDNLMGAAAVVAKVEAVTDVVMADNEPILAAIIQLTENMNRNHQQTIAILQDINSSVQNLVDQASFANAAPAENYQYTPPAPVHETTELVTALEASAGPAPNTASYLNQMGAGPVYASSGPRTSYAPTKSNVARMSGGAGFGSYLDNF